MHRAAVKFDKSVLKDRVIATVTFGDGGQQASKAKPIYESPVGPIPVWPDELDGKIMFNASISILRLFRARADIKKQCAKGDLTCTPGGSSTLAHLTYGTGSYISDSAKFVQQHFQGAKGAFAAAPGPGRRI